MGHPQIASLNGSPGGLFFAGDDELGEPEESSLEVVVGEILELGYGMIGEADRFLIGGIDGFVAGEDGENVLMGDAVEGSLFEDSLNLRALARSAVLKGVDHRESGLAFSQIAGYGLAENRLGGREVEYVISDLESHADRASVLPEEELLFLGSSAQNSAELHANREEAGRLAVDKVEVAIAGDQRSELFNLEEFALDHLLGEFR